DVRWAGSGERRIGRRTGRDGHGHQRGARGAPRRGTTRAHAAGGLGGTLSMADRVDEGTGPPESGTGEVPAVAVGAARENAQTGWAAHRGGDFRVLGYLVTSAPIIMFVFLRVAAPDFFDPLFTNPPAIAGLPLGIVMMAGVL